MNTPNGKTPSPDWGLKPGQSDWEATMLTINACVAACATPVKKKKN